MILRLHPIISVSLLLFGLAPFGPAVAQGFSVEPLRAPVAWPENDLPRDDRALLAWSPTARSTEGDQAIAEGREQIFALITERVRRTFAATGRVTIPGSDTLLGRLMAYADTFGVMNAAPLAAALGSPLKDTVSMVAKPEFALTLASETFTLTAKSGRWSIQFPWYFMLSGADRVAPADRPTIDIVTLSTLTSAISPPTGGASQGTILVVSNESEDPAQFTAIWLGRLGLTPDDTIPKGSPQALQAYKRYDTEMRMHVELNAFKIPSGSLLIAYIGLDGTYQANRQHYLDLMATIRVRQPS